MHSVCDTKATILFMEVGISYLEIFPNKMSVYVRLQCINPSTIRREISFKDIIIIAQHSGLFSSPEANDQR